MVGEATGRHREILDMMGFLRSSQKTKGPKTKTLGKNEKQSSAKASMPNYALTTRDVVIDRMTPRRMVFSAAC
jgi:hypothetical protein